MQNKQVLDNLIVSIKNNNNENESLKELSKICQNLYYRMVHNFLQKFHTGDFFDSDFLFKSRDLIIYNCAKKFDKSRKIKFETYLGATAYFF